MSKAKDSDDMRDEYDFSGVVRGKYADRYHKDAVAVVLDPDVAKHFSSPEAVNEALRVYIRSKQSEDRSA